MIQTSQNPRDTSIQNKTNTPRHPRAGLRRLMEPCLRFFERLQDRSHEMLAKRVAEERVTLRESRSAAVIGRRPGISEKSLSLARKMKERPVRDKPILIVDDEKNIRLTLSTSLETLGLETDSAEDGREALAKLRDKEFGVVLLDLRMPGLNGMDVLRQAIKSRPDIRVIILSAYGTIDLAVEAMKLGAVDFIPKPFAPEEIRERVVRVLDTEKAGQTERNRGSLFN